MDAIKTGHTYKDLMEMIACDCKSKICMVHRCDKSLRTDPLRQYIETLLKLHDQITFHHRLFEDGHTKFKR